MAIAGRSVKLLLASASAVNLGFVPGETHEHIFVLSKTLTCFEMGILYDEGRGRTITGHDFSAEWLLTDC
jgi:hypothetical protein